MAKDKPKPLPVFIESNTGFGLKFEFIQTLYEQIINTAYGEYDLDLEWIKIENYLDEVIVTVACMSLQKKYAISINDPVLGDIYTPEERLSRSVQRLVRGLKHKIEIEIGATNS